MGHFLDILLWVFPGLSGTIEEWRQSGSPVPLILAALLIGLCAWLLFLAIAKMAALGFDEKATDAFVAEIRRIAAVGEVSEVEDMEFGRKYTVPSDLKGPAGTAQVLTVWIREAGQGDVRLVTVRPR